MKTVYWIPLLLALVVTLVAFWVIAQAPRLEPPTGAAVEEAFERTAASTKVTEVEAMRIESGASTETLNLYIDGSESMQGFLWRSTSNFHRTLGQILDRAISGQYELNVFKFGAEVEAFSGDTAEIQSARFYSRGDTSFPELFRRIEERREPGSVAIVVTDLVQSNGIEEQRGLPFAFRQLVEERHAEVLLIARRSSFVGQYWPEHSSAEEKFRLRLDGGGRDGRPYYLLFIGDDVEDLERLRRRLELDSEREGPEAWMLDASRPAVFVKQADFLPQAPSINGPPVNRGSNGGTEAGDSGTEDSMAGEEPPAKVVGWGVAKPSERLSDKGRTQRNIIWLVKRGSPRLDSRVPVRYETRHHTMVEDLSRLRAEVKVCVFTEGVPCEKPESASIPIQVLDLGSGNSGPERENPGDDLLVRYNLPRPQEGTWAAYQIRLLPGDANLRQSIDDENWSTDDDSQRDHGNRTYKLDLFVDTLTTSLREPVAFVEQYIVLGSDI